MASDWTAEDFLAPKGNIVPAMFPSDSSIVMEERVDEYISAAEVEASALTGADLNRAVYHYVYWKAYSAAFVRMSATPTTNILADQGTIGFTQGQINSFRDLAKEHEQLFNNAVAEVNSSIAVAPVTRSISNTFTY
jgi:hypothetical protein